MFIFGSSAIMGISPDVHQESWFVFIFAFISALPIILIYARIAKLYPQKNINEIINILFGSVLSKIILFMFLWYSIHLAALVIRNIVEYVKISTLHNTPMIIVMILLTLTCVYLAKSGVTVLGRWALVCLILLAFQVVLTILFSIDDMNFNYLYPIFEHSPAELALTAFQIVSFPFAESVLFLFLLGHLKKGKSPYKVMFYGALIAGVLLFLIVVRNTAVLGMYLEKVYFSSFNVARIIRVSTFLTRIEGIITFNLLLAGITKITVCLIAAAKALKGIAGIGSSKKIVFPLALLAMVISGYIYQNTTQMFDFIDTYKFYAIPFQIVLPLIIWITAEIKSRKDNKPQSDDPQPQDKEATQN